MHWHVFWSGGAATVSSVTVFSVIPRVSSVLSK